MYVKEQINDKWFVTRKYLVTEKFLANPENNDHIRAVYKDTNKPIITLITCNGIWDPIKKEYTFRLVVQGELVG